MSQKPQDRRKLHALETCKCEVCKGGERGHYNTQVAHDFINRFICTLDERGRRLFAGVVAAIHAAMYAETNEGKNEERAAIEQWGISLTSTITSLWPATIKKGLSDLESADYRKLADEGRTRRKGAGRKPMLAVRNRMTTLLIRLYFTYVRLRAKLPKRGRLAWKAVRTRKQQHHSPPGTKGRSKGRGVTVSRCKMRFGCGRRSATQILICAFSPMGRTKVSPRQRGGRRRRASTGRWQAVHRSLYAGADSTFRRPGAQGVGTDAEG